MKTFANLVNALDSTNKTNQKLEAINQFLIEADEKDKLWFLALFTGKKPKRNVNSRLMKDWIMEVAQIPEWLFVEAYSSVGDLGETIALLLPEPNQTSEKSLAKWMQDIIALKDKTETEKREFVLDAWNSLSTMERFIFNKLLGGSFRLGVSSKSLINALAKHYDMEPSAVAHSIMGDWKMDEVTFDGLIRGDFANIQLSKPYPFCLAYALDKDLVELGEVDEWQVEYKWDGIRGQFIKREDEIHIWSRGEELITEQFPELVESLSQMQGDFVIDGEILVIRNGEVQNFTELQKRLNRKTISKKMLEELPIQVIAYDLLEWNGEDFREKSMQLRRETLNELLQENENSRFQISPLVEFSEWSELNEIRQNAREINSEGLMLKHKNSPYHTGRKRGDWWKWKIEPLTIDAVLIYAQKGSGRRSAHYTDYTFAVRDGEKLVTIAKAYSGLTDLEIKEVSQFVNKNAIEKFGPVRTVKPELVFEIAFEGIGYSSRHKSGVALRFPRILRWRKDKTVAEIDTLEEVKKLIT